MNAPRSLICLGWIALILCRDVAQAGGVAAARTGEALVVSSEVPIVYEAIGTVRPVTEAMVMAQASGRILSVEVREGDKVVVGQKVARIEDRQFSLRASQAREAVRGAEAGYQQAAQAKLGAEAALEQATAEYERVKKFLKQGAATPQAMERAESAFKQARAQVARAESGVKASLANVSRAKNALSEVIVTLDYAVVKSPILGVVTARLVEPGDLAWPGRPLLKVTDHRRMRLEANVPEGMAGLVRQGELLGVRVDALGLDARGTVSQVVPSTDPVSRTFVVKVDLPPDDRLLTGMFGRVTLRTGSRKVLTISRDALQRVGQLQMVQVRDAGKGAPWSLRLVRVGELLGGSHYEVLSGLRAGEIVRIQGKAGDHGLR